MRNRLIAVFGLLMASSAGASGQMGIEVAHYDLSIDDQDNNGVLFGVFGEARTEGPLMLAAQGRALKGNVRMDSSNDTSTTETMSLLEARGLIGGPIPGGITAYTGAGARQVQMDGPDGEERTSRTLYVPLGLTDTKAFPSYEWQIRTDLEAGFVVWGTEDLEGTINGTSYNETLTRTSGWQGRVAINFRRSFQNMALTITPFVRAYGLGQTDTEVVNGDSLQEDKTHITEAGLRIGIAL